MCQIFDVTGILGAPRESNGAKMLDIYIELLLAPTTNMNANALAEVYEVGLICYR